MAHVYVCYAEHDAPFAEQLAIQLQQRGIVTRPEFSPSLPGFTPPSTDPAILDEATHVLLVLSPASVTDQTLREACAYVHTLNKRIVGVLCESCEIPAEFNAMPTVDFRGRFLMGTEELVRRLQKTGAPTRPPTVEHPPPVAKPDLLPHTLPAERCWREDRLQINYVLPMLADEDELAFRLPVFFSQTGFEPERSTHKMFKARRTARYALFDPRRAEHTLTVKRRKGSLKIYYRMTRLQVYYWFPAHYRVLNHEAAALYRYLATGRLTPEVLQPVDRQAILARIVSWSALVVLLALIAGLVLLITL